VKSAAGETLVFSLMLNRSALQPAGRAASRELDDIAVMVARLNARAPRSATNSEAGSHD
jgi:hypothetical protein